MRAVDFVIRDTHCFNSDVVLQRASEVAQGVHISSLIVKTLTMLERAVPSSQA